MNQPPPQQPPYPQQMQYGQHPPYPPPRQGMSQGLKIFLIVGGVVLGIMVLSGVLVGVLAVATIPKLTEAQQKLEIKQVGDLNAGLQNIAADDRKKRHLHKHSDVAGVDLWAAMFSGNMMDSRLAPHLVSLNSNTDTKAADSSSIGRNNCSYTLPKGGELLSTMARKGSKRCVLITFNSRNWNNYPDKGVVVQWSDGEVAEWLTFEQAQADWGITRAEWDDPAGQLFGKKAPFEHTYE